MSRRSHVVRTDDQGPTGQSRSLGETRIFCAYDACGNVYSGGDGGNSVEVAGITITATRSYQRCFVSATIGRVESYLPDPPPPPAPQSFSVIFIPPPSDADSGNTRWFSDGFDINLVGGAANIDTAVFQNLPGGTYASEYPYIGAYNDATGVYDSIKTLPNGDGSVSMSSVWINTNFNYSQMLRGSGYQCTLLCHAETDLVIEGSEWVVTSGHTEVQS